MLQLSTFYLFLPLFSIEHSVRFSLGTMLYGSQKFEHWIDVLCGEMRANSIVRTVYTCLGPIVDQYDDSLCM